MDSEPKPTMQEFINEGSFIEKIPVVLITWDEYEDAPSSLVWEDGWDALDNEQRYQILTATASTLAEMMLHIVPDYPPEDLQG